MANKNLRSDIQAAGVKHWQVARAAGISPATLCVWLREELSPGKEAMIRRAIVGAKRKYGDPDD